MGICLTNNHLPDFSCTSLISESEPDVESTSKTKTDKYLKI